MYVPTIKSSEFLVYVAVCLVLCAKEDLNFQMASAPFVPISFFGIYFYMVELMVDADDEIQEAYYELNWFEAPVASRKLILLASQKPMEVRFGELFGEDYASFQRFSQVIHNAYDIGLIIVGLTK